MLTVLRETAPIAAVLATMYDATDATAATAATEASSSASAYEISQRLVREAPWHLAGNMTHSYVKSLAYV